MNQDTQLAAALQSLFGEEADQLARELGVVKRKRVFSGSSLLQTLVLGLMHLRFAKTQQLAQFAAHCNAPVTPQAMAKRFTPELVEFLKRLFESAVTKIVAGQPKELGLLRRFPAVIVQDSTVITLPDSLSKQWLSCGGPGGKLLSALKIQLQWNVLSGAFHGIRIEQGRQSDQTTTLTSQTFVAESLHLADLGYFKVARLADMSRNDMRFVSRIQVKTAIFESGGRRLDLWAWLARRPAAEKIVELAVEIGEKERFPCRLAAWRCPAEVVRKRLKRLAKDAARKGRKVSEEQRRACAWTVLVTNVPVEKLTSHEIFTIYRVRWQIELLFKLWKQGNGLTPPREGNPVRVVAELYAKLLGVLVQHWIVLSTVWSAADRSLTKATRWIRENMNILGGLIAKNRWERLGEFLDDLRTELLKTARITPRRKRPSTFQILNPPNPLNPLIA